MKGKSVSEPQRTKVLPCDCTQASSFMVKNLGIRPAKIEVSQRVLPKGGAEYQDAKYGKGKRLHNQLKPVKGKAPLFRCSLCGKTKE